MSFKERLLLWWGSLHIGEVIRRRAVQRELRRLLNRHRLHASPSRSPSSVEGEKMLTVLDAGCGRGDIAFWIARRYPNVAVDAVDIDPKLVVLVQRRSDASGLRNIDAMIGDIERFMPTPSPTSPFPLRQGFAGQVGLRGTRRSPSQREGEKKMYGTMYSVDVFEHLKDPARAIVNLAAVLVPGGALLIHVPRVTQRRFFRRFEHYEQHDHERDGFEPEDLISLVRAADLHVAGVRHTFGPPGALAWELFHLAQGVGKWLALLTYPIPCTLAWIDGWFRWKRGNGMLVVARNGKAQSSNVK